MYGGDIIFFLRCIWILDYAPSLDHDEFAGTFVVFLSYIHIVATIQTVVFTWLHEGFPYSSYSK